MSNKTVLLEVSNLEFSYSEECILKDISFKVHSQEIFGIIGPNGGGKSTLLKLIAGLLTPDKGVVKFSNTGLAKTNVAYVPQFHRLNPSFPMVVDDYLNFAFLNGPIDENFKLEVLKLTNLIDRQFFPFHQLSGGQKQRVILALAMLKRPNLLILDEPSKALDSKGRDQLQEMILEIKKNYSSGIIIVDHHLKDVISLSDHILCINKTQHWHDQSQAITTDILNHIYHCEFEHTLLHEQLPQDELVKHHECEIHDDSQTYFENKEGQKK